MLHRKGATPDATVAQAGDEPVACGDEACVVDGMGNQPVWRIYVVEVEGTLRLHGIAQLSLGAVGVDWAEAARAHVDRVLADSSQHPCSSLAVTPGSRAGGGAAR